MPRKPEDTKYAISATLQTRIKDAIEEQELTKVQFAKAAGVNIDVIIKATVYQIVPRTKSIIKIADYLQVPIMHLFDEEYATDFLPSKNPTNFYDRLEQLAKEKGVKYSAITHKVSCAPNAINEWFRTNSLPSLDYLIELAEYFDVSVDYLLGRTDERK